MRGPGLLHEEECIRKEYELGGPLLRIAEAVDWDAFRVPLDVALNKPRKSNAGRKEYDRVMMFKILVLQQLNNLSDDRTEFLIRDRLSFMRFLGLELGDAIPDAKTIWRFRDTLKSCDALADLFEELDRQITDLGFVLCKGRIVDATFVAVPRQRNTREENATVKHSEPPEG